MGYGKWDRRGRKKAGRNRKNSQAGKELCFGLLILMAVFIVTGLVSAIQGEEVSVNGDAELVDDTEAGGAKEKDIKQENDDKEDEVQDGKNIRVLILTDGFRGEVHPEVTVSADSGMTVSYGNTNQDYGENEEVTVKPDQEWFSQGLVYIKAKKGKVKIGSLKRGDGTPSYDGTLELRTTTEGIVVVNDLPVEKYLCGVVPSEMPASYELEALKAQAVCARSYAYQQMKEYAYPEYEAHVNDSTDYQVYNNSGRAKESSKAVKATKGETVRYQGKTVTTYYYSTSCGRTTTVEAWGTKPSQSNGYLQSVEVKGERGDYEKDLPWYRWSAEIPVETLSDLVGLNIQKDLGKIKQVKVVKRGPGEVALKVKITGEKGKATVKTENKIRKAFGGAGYRIRLQDGSETKSRDLLPSAFFEVKKKNGCFTFEGGGFGHGIGMSQTGANEMAKQGKNYKEILGLFYQDTEVR